MNSQHCGGLRKSWSAPFFVARNLIVIGLVLCSCGMARGDWSPEILIWENPPNTQGGSTEASMVIDSSGHVHIVYSHVYYDPAGGSNPTHVGFSYVQFDDRGNQLVPPIFIADSTFDSGGLPVIRLFGQDSLWAMWGASRDYPLHAALQYVCLDLNGNVLTPVRDFERPHFPSSSHFIFDVASDRKVIVVDATGVMDGLLMTVQEPTGERIMEDELIWSQLGGTTDPIGYIDFTDSLQVFWTQGYYGQWWAAYAKRINIQVPFDTLHRSDYVSLTPQAAFWPKDVLPVGDSLIVVMLGYPGLPYQVELRLYSRETYEQILEQPLGVDPGKGDFAFESDSILCVAVGDSSDRSLHFRRLSFPNLEVLDDTILSTPSEIGFTGLRALAVSQQGVRHVLYVRQVAPSGSGSMRLYYRYSPYTPNDADRPRAISGSDDYILYPNPTNGSISLFGPLAKVQSIKLFNLLGQQVRAYSNGPGNSFGQSFSLSMDNLPSGTYYLELQETYRIVTKTFQFVR